MKDAPLRFAAEAALFYLLFGLLRALPLDPASWLGGALARRIGPHLSRSRAAERQLRRILAGRSDAEYRRILRDMWEQLGRTMAEFPHLNRPVMAERITFANPGVLADAPAQRLYVAGHLGNWEILPRVAAMLGTPPHILYRPTNNPYLDRLIQRVRAGQAIGQERKGVAGARELYRTMKAGRSLGMLIDQKENNGISLPFMGETAMTGTLPARLALDGGLTIVAMRVKRLQGCRFVVEFAPPIVASRHGDRKDDIQDYLSRLHGIVGEWIAEDPAQWFWVHHRWPKPPRDRKE